jgi:RNA-directed DNA polymerase
VLQEIEAGRLETGAEYRGEVSRGHSRRRSPRRRPERWKTKDHDDGATGTHQTIQRKLAAAQPPDEPVAGSHGQPESIPPRALLAQVLERANLQRALKQVRQNQGAPGIDGMTVDELPDYLRTTGWKFARNWKPGVTARNRSSAWTSLKGDGKTRPLGIPTVLDRFIQQAIAQVVSAQWEPHFHPHSYGFRPQPLGPSGRAPCASGRSGEGYGWVVDMDLQASLTGSTTTG